MGRPNSGRLPDEWSEPRIHSFITDSLEEGHPLNGVTVECERCGRPLNYSNNECMGTWVEAGEHAVCLQCFAAIDAAEADESGRCWYDKLDWRNHLPGSLSQAPAAPAAAAQEARDG